MRLKIQLTIAVACLVGILFGYYLKEAKEQTAVRLTLLNEITLLEQQQKQLDGEILQSAFFLYHDYDRIHATLGQIKRTLTSAMELRASISSNHSQVCNLLDGYRQIVELNEERIIRLLTLNSMLKNSAMYVPNLTRQAGRDAPMVDPHYHALLADLNSTLYLSRNSLDPDLLHGLSSSLEALEAYPPPAGIEHLHPALLAHGRVFAEALPDYSLLLSAILQPATSTILRQLQEALITENSHWLIRLNRLTYIFFGAFLVSMLLVIALLLKTERENRDLNRLSAALSAAATTDNLTQLANRFAFDQDQESRQQPLLFLINIDDFKHINDLYGVQTGDHVLIELAGRLEKLPAAGRWCRCYRLGGDDFGLLLEEPADFNPEELARSIVAAVEGELFVHREQPIRLSISLGISRQRPLLETADMALKETKKLKRTKFTIYRSELNLQAQIAANLQTLQKARRALAEDDILVYYQPIFDNLSGEIARYECLVRMRDEDGTIFTPGRFLDLVKESSLYPQFTMRVVAKSFSNFSDCRYGFSINLALTDILDSEVREYILALIDANPATASRLTFEILENEGMKNVEEVRSFITRVKRAGCQIAVDDFGSGYSNFAHLLMLQVDTLKIDASLIRDLDHDTQARVMVQTIVDFCRKLEIKTVAEFVHSAAVHQVVKELGIDYSQGFHLAEPAPRPLHLTRT
ncbi:MAG TPA: EAL domain-containing protein [Desulfurivibrio alkaliphilus]|uniref:EAL domain-containing protein n=1 Tax=Desulfurivibrio alkaliphilus TaxID=427923 RepID=A0A7C2TH31_9BACT|nr:EAL domain-containing protein [Desulfurivibrio alkaliphilus]